MDLFHIIENICIDSEYVPKINEEKTLISIIRLPEKCPCIIIFVFNQTPKFNRLECNREIYKIIKTEIKKYPSVKAHQSLGMVFGVNITTKGIIRIVKNLVFEKLKAESQKKDNNMNIHSFLNEILNRIDTLISEQKQTAHNAIDLADWQEAQTQLKQAQASISSLKSWKERILVLARDFESSDVFKLDQERLSFESHSPAYVDGLSGIETVDSRQETDLYESDDEIDESEDFAVCEDESSLITDSGLTADDELNNENGSDEYQDLDGVSAADTSKNVVSAENIINPDKFIRICEELILKKPYQMAVIYLYTAFSDKFTTIQQSEAYMKFKTPHKLSNGIWVETQNNTDSIINAIYDYCEMKL